MMTRNKISALILFFLIYPQSVTPQINASVSVGRYFAVALKHVSVSGACQVVKEGWSGGRSEQEATAAALVACGNGCVSLVTFNAVP